MKKCKSCNQTFEIFPEDRAIYEIHEMAEPLLCPDCREQLRSSHINQLNLFIRNCDATGKRIVSHYPPSTPFKVYSQEYWYSDAVDNTVCGRDFDFSRTFFEQFEELLQSTPRAALFTDFLRDENSSFTNYSGKNKDCYLIFDSDESRNCTNSYSINNSTNSSDCYRGDKLEQCLECVDCKNCYGSAFLFNCDTCNDSAFLANCIGCSYCMLSSNLHHKRYYVMNEQVTAEQYAALRKELGKAIKLEELIQTFEKFRQQFPQKFQRGFQNENVIGNYLLNCKDAFHCYDCRELRDGRYCFQTFMKVTNGMDLDQCGDGELLFECSNLGYNAYNNRFSMNCLNQIRDLTYCDMCFNGCSDLFGCIGLKKKSYCILNRQYSKEEYHKLVPQIISHMKITGEWGSFFPARLSPFSYNLTIASSFYPLDRETALTRGFRWDETQSTVTSVAEPTYPPEDINQCNGNNLLQTVFNCKKCNKGYKFTSEEFELYKTLQIALPNHCFHCRHNRRLASRNPRRLWPQLCSKCQIQLLAAYDPSQKQLVYCEPCYQESLE